jgi:hypothetical protein
VVWASLPIIFPDARGWVAATSKARPGARGQAGRRASSAALSLRWQRAKPFARDDFRVPAEIF